MVEVRLDPRNFLDKVQPDLAKKIRVAAGVLRQQGIDLRVTSGLRTMDEQAAIYAQGRTEPGEIVTWAKPGESLHNYALAVDVVPMKAGKAWWEAPETVWEQIGRAGEAQGLAWGGRWQGKKDRPHFEVPGLHWRDARAIFDRGGMPAVWGIAHKKLAGGMALAAGVVGFLAVWWLTKKYR